MKGKLQEHMGQAGVRRGERWQTRTLDQEPASGRAMAPGLGRKGLQGLPELLHSSLPHSLPALLPHLPLPLLLRFFLFLPLTILHSFSFVLSCFLNSHFHCPFSFPNVTLLSLLLLLSLFTTTVQLTFLTWKMWVVGSERPLFETRLPHSLYDLSRLALGCQVRTHK